MMEICNNCPCNCKPVSAECIQRYSDIIDPTILQDSHYQKATDDIDSLIGVHCADELCEALKQGVIDLNEYNQNKLPSDPIKTIDDFISDKWLDIINNRHFKKWYSNKLLWHWLHGASISEISASGLVTLSNSDDDNKNDFQQATEKERVRMQDSSQFYADGARKKFLDSYWNLNAHLYSCVQSYCEKEQKCKTPQSPPNNGIGMYII